MVSERLKNYVIIPLNLSIEETSKVKVKWKSLSRFWLFVTPWTIQSMEFSRPEYWSGQPFPSPGDLSNPGIEPRSPTLQEDSLPTELSWKPRTKILKIRTQSQRGIF